MGEKKCEDLLKSRLTSLDLCKVKQSPARMDNGSLTMRYMIWVLVRYTIWVLVRYTIWVLVRYTIWVLAFWNKAGSKFKKGLQTIVLTVYFYHDIECVCVCVCMNSFTGCQLAPGCPPLLCV